MPSNAHSLLVSSSSFLVTAAATGFYACRSTCSNAFSLPFIIVICSTALCFFRFQPFYFTSQKLSSLTKAFGLEKIMNVNMGCDASVLLDGTSAFQNEDLALQNKNFRGKNFIADAKAQLENACPGVFSCADILAVAARDASKAVGGPTWEVKLGRRDSTVANLTQASNDLPKFFMGLDQLIALFNRKGLTARDMVALIGAHTIGQAPCITFRPRVYDNSSDIDAEFAASKRDMCPFTPPEGDLNLAPFDPITPTTFDNNFYKNLLIKKGLIASDQVLFSGGSTDSIVKEYTEDASKFYSDFAVAIVKLGDMLPLTGSEGIIRKVCNVVD